MKDYNGSVVRAIRGPICLITIGALFALNNFTRFRFDQTWPVILIVFGLLSLLKRSVETSAPPPPAPAQSRGYSGSGYSQSPYSQTPPAAAPAAAAPSSAGSPSEPAKGGFGTSAPPRADAPPSKPASGEGGSV